MTFIFPRGAISGLGLSTAGGSSTFSIAAGQAADSTNAAIMNFAATMAKTTAAWIAGNGHGALDAGSIAASTWYHVYLIQTADTTSTDVLISLSVSAPTLPANYTLFRRIGSLKTNGSSQWVKFVQNGNDFLWDVPIADVSAFALTTTSTLFPLSVPIGVSVSAQFLSLLQSSASGSQYCVIQSPLVAIQATNVPPGNISLITAAASTNASGQFLIITDTSANIRVAANAAGPTFYIITTGWIDKRGRDA